MIAELLGSLARANLAFAAAVLLLLVVRRPVRRAFGAGVAYRLWWLPPLIAAASLAPFPNGEVWFAMPIAATPAAPWIRPPAALSADVWRPLAVAAWISGALVSAGVLAVRQGRFIAALGGLRPAVVRGRAVQRAGRALIGPAVVGSSIVVPADFEARFTAEEQDAILAHEAAHLARGDVPANVAAALIQCLCWFNPLVHLAAFHHRVDQELACDAAVIEARPEVRRSYGEALFKTQIAPAVPPVGCLWPSRAQHPLKERIVMLKLAPPTPSRRRLGAAVLAAAALGGGYAAWAANPGRMVRPDWDQRPTGADLVRFYPAEAVRQRLPGEGLMQCAVETDGYLSGCAVLLQSPEGAGFGEAMLQMAPLFHMKPLSRDGRPVAGGIVRIPIAFRLAPGR